ncbi:MBL fold metallo-hydrolase [Mycetocola tolaasinivorans]|uniref:MBL fold metallo-hydrolase n=1 Tax=Mycetocola tolaasinivorans TaxID=76635 RepID=A0A3L7ACX9_9MICO|nr:MBL fold metallo-hydrolase [Mycetocola tolaasinivorans]RLP77511.1 MBL fold metallo-hydrolase [Mycetocola tolaasinivorans]
MELTKYAHATVTLEKDGHELLIDPGTFTTNIDELLAGADAVLITHEHGDHFDKDRILAALETRPDLPIYAPAQVTAQLPEGSGNIHTVAAGFSGTIAGFSIEVFGETHALIHALIPQIDNVGFLIDGTVFHPGDAYLVPGVPVDTLLVPTSGPWAKLGEAIDYVREVAPKQSVQIHDLLLSEPGRQMSGYMLGNDDLTGVPFTTLAEGESLSV